jgi:cyclohexanone monooxygenase
VGNTYEALVIGAGFAGLGMLWQLKEMNVSAHCFEAGTDVGGTWYWNKYPGARTDSEAWYYCFSFSGELNQEWKWKERYPSQKEVRSYLSHVAERFSLREHITFRTRVTKAAYDESEKLWTVVTDRGEEYKAKYLISAMGILSSAFVPPWPGFGDFKGRHYLTAQWPETRPDFNGRRVGLIGTGATGVQITPHLAEECARLTVFQRTPNYVVEAQNHALTDHFLADIKSKYPEIWRQVDRHAFAMPFEVTGRVHRDFTAEERNEIFEEGWRRGGFRFLFETFDDLLVDKEANEAASEFIRNKIRSIVKDKKTAELLCPKGYPYGSKRPPAGHGYYETFNRDNVDLVDISENEITRILPEGIELKNGTKYELDDIVIATGFDAFTGALVNVDIRGKSGVSLADKWRDGPRTLFGVATNGFPNLFMITGPLSTFGNVPSTIESNIRWICGAISYLKSNKLEAMEVNEHAEDAWVKTTQEAVDATLISEGARANSWILGANIPGKKHVPVAFLGGYNNYVDMMRAECEEYPSFSFEPQQEKSHVQAQR